MASVAMGNEAHDRTRLWVTWVGCLLALVSGALVLVSGFQMAFFRVSIFRLGGEPVVVEGSLSEIELGLSTPYALYNYAWLGRYLGVALGVLAILAPLSTRPETPGRKPLVLGVAVGALAVLLLGWHLTAIRNLPNGGTGPGEPMLGAWLGVAGYVGLLAVALVTLAGRIRTNR